jgi:hypothetical protein
MVGREVLSDLWLSVDAAETVPLPGDPAGPLHFPTPPSCAWLVVWFLLVVGLLVWLGRLLWRRLRRYSESRPTLPKRRPKRKPVPFGINTAIAGILSRHLKAGTFRQGCHELSDALRTYWEERGLVRPAGPRFTRMTAREIEGRVGDHPASRLISLLSQLQFGRHEPSREDLQGACELASELVAKGSGG